MNTLRIAAATIAVLILIPTTAQAKHRHHHRHYQQQRMHVDRYPAMAFGFYSDGNIEYDSGHVVAHPPGCPGRAFCGCGVSVKVFGRPVRDLFLASNWYRFPRAAPAAGMVAVRRHHVMYIMAYSGNGAATVYDPNSGGRQTRIHTRSLAGYTVVNPHGSRYAGL